MVSCSIKTKVLLYSLFSVLLLVGAILSPAWAPSDKENNIPLIGKDGDFCQVEGTSFSLYVQVALGLLAFSILIVKRLREHPRRHFKVWLMDSSKQGLSSAAAHFCGMLSAYLASERLESPSTICGWYLAAFIIDTCLGVHLAHVYLTFLEAAAKKNGWTSLERSGDYRDPKGMHNPDTHPDPNIWFKQASSFVVIVIVARLHCMLFLLSFSNLLRVPVVALCNAFRNNPNTFLILIMLVGPGCLNAIQFYLQDNFLKKSTQTAQYIDKNSHEDVEAEERERINDLNDTDYRSDES